MLNYPCLVLDHDDTVVQSETTINYPYFCYILDVFRPGATITLQEYVDGCSRLGFADMCRQWYQFTQQELDEEYQGWKAYVRTHTPPPYPGIADLIARQKAEGGLICVVSHSSEENILRDYRTHFGMTPDAVYGWELPAALRKPAPYSLLHIMERFHLTAKELLVVDDMEPAADMASSAGVDIAFAAWGKQEHRQLCQRMKKLCNYSFDTPIALSDFLFTK